MDKKLIVVLVSSALLGACENPTDATHPEETAAEIVVPVDLAETTNPEKIAEWLNQRYKTQPPSGGWWRVHKVEVNGEDIDVSVLTTYEHAEMIMQLPPEAQFKTVSIAACPEPSEEIWRMINQSQRLNLHVGWAGGIFIDVDCRKWSVE